MGMGFARKRYLVFEPNKLCSLLYFTLAVLVKAAGNLKKGVFMYHKFNNPPQWLLDNLLKDAQRKK